MTTIAEPMAVTDEIVVLRRSTYDALIEAVEDALDARALAELRDREAAGEAEYVPIELADKMLAGEHPVRVWREYRGLTLSALAKSADVPASYLSEIENGKKPGSARALGAIAKVLRVDIEDLLTGAPDAEAGEPDAEAEKRSHGKSPRHPPPLRRRTRSRRSASKT
jgi:transcriptional regulator with XRE-family HTH domain